MKSAIIVGIVAMVAVCLCNPIKADMIVTPASIAFNIAGGSTIHRNVVIDWDGNMISAGRIWTNVTPNGTGIYIEYNIPTWDHYFFLQPHHQNITMTISANPALQPGNYTITTYVEAMKETQIIIQNNTVTVVDPWLQEQYATLTGNRNSLQENLSTLYIRFTELQMALDNATLNLEREREKATTLHLALIGFFIFGGAIVLLAIGYASYKRRKRSYRDMSFPDGTFPIDGPEEVNIVGRRHAR